jgi:uncharacterized caspase-like protein
MRLSGTLVCAILILWLGTASGYADKRVALIIGNGAYVHAKHLPNPVHDAEDVGAALRRIGFETIVETNLDQAAMQSATVRFAREARTADVAFFYYSGHALQYEGVNFLIPVDAELRDEADLRRLARADEILADLQRAKNLRVLVLDSCRDSPLADELKRSIGPTRGVSIARGLARMDSPIGTIVSYSTQAGRTADDGTGRNSPYTNAFLQHIEDKDDIKNVFHHISAKVYEASGGTQLPELSLSFFGEFYLNGELQVAARIPSTTNPCSAAADHWKSAEAIGSLAAFEDHLARFPNCAFAQLAKARIEGTKNQAASVNNPQSPANLASPKQINLTRFVTVGKATKIGFVNALFPDCSSMGKVVVSIKLLPDHGKVSFAEDTSFTTFPAGHQLVSCNSRKTQGLRITYRSNVGYVGADTAVLQLLFPDGSAGEWHYSIVVSER